MPFLDLRKRKMKKVLIVMACIFSAACTTTPQDISRIKLECAQIGFRPGTDGHAQCTMYRLNKFEQERPRLRPL